MKQDATYFENKEAVLVYIAKRLRDALRLEAVLTEAGIDYGVEVDHYLGGIIFRRQRAGAFFYVVRDAVEPAFAVMREHGYVPHVE